jgi:hypothetical protein
VTRKPRSIFTTEKYRHALPDTDETASDAFAKVRDMLAR